MATTKTPEAPAPATPAMPAMPVAMPGMMPGMMAAQQQPNPMFAMMQMMQMMMGGMGMAPQVDPSAIPFASAQAKPEADRGLDADIIRPSTLTPRGTCKPQ